MPERALGLELQTDMSCLVGVGIEPRSSGGGAHSRSYHITFNTVLSLQACWYYFALH
ncbi:mCG148316 [Mus musculus]|nr:mCG148316 [Mus musculus]